MLFRFAASRHRLRSLLIAATSIAMFSAGCADDQPTPSSTQFIGERDAACTPAELEPLVACSAEPCEGLAGDPLNECMGNNCPESVFDVSEGCGECIVYNLSSVEDIARVCGAVAPEPTATACTDTEMDPLVACSATPCAGLSGDPLMSCIDESCPESVFDVTETCANCIIANQSSVEHIAQACATPPAPVVACSAAEMDPLAACAAEPCADLSGDPLMECMDENCPDSVWEALTEPCAQCMILNQSSFEAMSRVCAGGETAEN